MAKQGMKLAIVAGEASGDLLGAELIIDLKALDPGLDVVAVGGAKIQATGVRLLRSNEVFSVMGLFEVLKDLPKILKAKNTIVSQILEHQPDLFIGVDAPDLNFSIAKTIRNKGVPVMHYVSPSVWAWRPGRVSKMANFIDALLTLFPFEVACYRNSEIDARFVGHPLARNIPVKIDKAEEKKALGTSGRVLAILPGSRNREIKTMMPVFAEAIRALQLGSEWRIMSANVNPEKVQMCDELAKAHGIELEWVDEAGDLLKAADLALVGSGTVALEAMLCKTPMVVAYRIAWMTHFLVSRFKLMLLPYYSLPNVLHGDFLVPEVMQDDLTPERLKAAMKQVLAADQEALIQRFTELHESLLPPVPNAAAVAVQTFLEEQC